MYGFSFVVLRAPPPSIAVYDLGTSNFLQLPFRIAVLVCARIRRSKILQLVRSEQFSLLLRVVLDVGQ